MFDEVDAAVASEETVETVEVDTPKVFDIGAEKNAITDKQSTTESSSFSIESGNVSEEFGLQKTADKAESYIIPFVVAGLKLAVHLDDYYQVLPYPDNLIHLTHPHPLLVGAMDNDGVEVRIIDTLALVMPKEFSATKMQRADSSYSQVILIGSGLYGLACDAVGECFTIPDHEIHWRTERTKRRWLAGTAIAHKCALLDVTGLMEIVNTG